MTQRDAAVGGSGISGHAAASGGVVKVSTGLWLCRLCCRFRCLCLPQEKNFGMQVLCPVAPKSFRTGTARQDRHLIGLTARSCCEGRRSAVIPGLRQIVARAPSPDNVVRHPELFYVDR